MTSPRLREVLASLHHERLRAAPPLSQDAERAIGRRLARRWALRGVAFAAAGSLVVAGAAAWVTSSQASDADAEATASPSPSETPVPTLARIPLGGGPEFTSIEDFPICGEPVPLPDADSQGFSLAVASAGAAEGWPTEDVGFLTASLSHATEDPDPAARGPLWILLVQDGRIAGATWIDASRVRDVLAQDSYSAEFVVPAASESFSCRKLSLRGPREYDLFPIEPGDYTAVAYTRVFATEESVALGQALPIGYEIREEAKAPGGVYLPGSYDCAVIQGSGIAVRGCFPDLVPGAQVDADSQTLSLLYDATGFTEAFDVTLVSEPLSVTLSSIADSEPGYMDHYDNPTRFASASDVVCGAVVDDYQGLGEPQEVDHGYFFGWNDVIIDARLPALEHLSEGTQEARVMPLLGPDGTTVRLEAGAQLVYFRPQTTDDESGWIGYEVVGFAPVEILDEIVHDRYRGPVDVALQVGSPAPCPGVDGGILLSQDAALLGTWTTVTHGGLESKHELMTPTMAYLPRADEILSMG
ncbi:hypothetical protein LGT39_08225 [Demequina sp. TTPB684]|uniref:hypothetical protein n=1 Tax=unclassified Demequina TaxID=2620311 RepID=UPI001CF167D9|nr:MULTISPECIES: hypothetical protein [unclassified Demequina]MCB2412830.1 hypothetical protein [Demequina sp. TTPB684]UPU87539.1 hypothetical protein LGT36_009740 [Demequina sp. TMPB413]